MGHWKVRKSGVFWWSEHRRNDPTGSAEIPKVYKVTA
jgi:hypothetical protein